MTDQLCKLLATLPVMLAAAMPQMIADYERSEFKDATITDNLSGNKHKDGGQP